MEKKRRIAIYGEKANSRIFEQAASQSQIESLNSTLRKETG